MRSIYVPALLTGIENPIKQIIKHPETNKFGYYKGVHDPSWFTDRAIFTHPHILVSHYYSGKIPDYRKVLGIQDDIQLWADSGGYSALTQNAKIDPVKVLKWQEKNSNIAFSLDLPPAESTGVTRCSPGKVVYLNKDKFEKHAEISRENNINFEGYATGAKPASNTLLQAMCTMFLYSKGVRERIHLLGVSGITVIPVLVWMSQYIDKISFDSTSYGYGSRTRAYVYPDRIRYYTHFGRKYATKKKQMEKIYCNCPICIDFDDPSYFIESDITWPGMLLSLHNLWAVKQYVEELDRTLNEEKDKEKFRKLVIQHTGRAADNAFHAINFVEDVIKYGYDKAYDVYFMHHDLNNKKFKSRSLLNV